MDTFTVLLFLGFSVGHTVEVPVVRSKCPPDYRRRVETCIMEAQLAPQAGGGITLVLHKDTIVNLCDRGMLRKTIDCLEEIHTRCMQNASVVQELDRLYSVPQWQQGAELLCQDSQLFQDNFDCLSRSANSVTTCILMRTNTFRLELALTNPADHASLKDVTCRFAESIVKCLCGPLGKYCPLDITKRVAGSMRLFLPPLCIADPGGGGGGNLDSGDHHHGNITLDVDKNVTVTTDVTVTTEDEFTAMTSSATEDELTAMTSSITTMTTTSAGQNETEAGAEPEVVAESESAEPEQ